MNTPVPTLHDGRVPHTCAYCQKELLDPKSSQQPDGGFHTSFTFATKGPEAFQAAKDGCAFWKWYITDYLDEGSRLVSRLTVNETPFTCSFTLYGDKNGYKEYPYPLRTVYRNREYKLRQDWWRDEKLTIIADEGGYMPYILHAQLMPDVGDPAYDYVHHPPRRIAVGSEENFAQARRWMQNCHESHDKCAKPEEGIVPTRLLDVSGNTVKLRCSIPGEILRWVALSYCWGGHQSLQTTTDTLTARLEDIPLSHLPRTIQDAITTARKVNLHYLWVDCLCIIQDDAVDVRREIATMPAIYRNATVVISAARAKSSSEGFLQDITTPTPQDESFRLRFLCPDGQIGSVILYGPDELEPKRDAIESRAWTLQEHLLSQRLLIFGSRNIWWTCTMVHTMYTNREINMHSEIGEIRLRFLNLYLTQLRRYYASIPGHTWLTLVQHYTNRTLTFPYDKLIAIAGCAEDYATKMGDRYLAGHFEKSLLSSLLWKRHGPLQSRPTAYRAPSWSWAAVDGQVRFEHFRFPMAESLEFVDCQVQLVSAEAPYGAVSAATLTLRGRVRKVLWSAARDCLFDAETRSKFLAETIPDALESALSIINRPDPVVQLPTTSRSSVFYCLELCPVSPPST